MLWLYLLLYPQNVFYENWVIENGYDEEGLEKQRAHVFSHNPKISIVIPMYNVAINHFEKLLESVKMQTYSNWELCIADGSSEQNPQVKALCQTDKCIKYIFLDENKGISGNTNEAIKLATGDYVGFMDHDDFLPAFSLYEIVKFINENPTAEFIYTDETHYYERKKNSYHSLNLKPTFSPDYLRSLNYICHFMIAKKELVEKLGGMRCEYDGSQDYDFALRATESTNEIYHIPLLLYHWRIHNKSFSKTSNLSAREAGKRAIEAQLKRLNLKADVKLQKDNSFYNVEYEIIGNPSVSIVIPNKDQVKLLKKCIDSITKLTTYDNYEVVIIENNSDEESTFDYYSTVGTTAPGRPQNSKIRILRYPDKGFNYSKLINFGVNNVSSDYVLQLNNDTVLLTPNWLELMLGYAQRRDVGAVGAKLYFPDKSIQHAGVAIPITPEIPCGHVFALLQKGFPGHMARTLTTMNYRAVTGACLMCRRELYERAGYMDEGFAKAYGDADLCMQFIKLGLVNVYQSQVELLHYESKTRGYDDTPEKQTQFKKEGEYFMSKWGSYMENGDPYFNRDILKLR